MQFFWQDLRYGFRTLLRNPGFCAVAILALALGIGPNTAIFTMVNAVLLQPLPVPEPNRVVMIWETLAEVGLRPIARQRGGFSGVAAQAHSFDQMSAAFTIPEFGLNVSGAGDPERVPAALASKEFLPALGIKPIVGRNFAPDEDLPGGRPAVLISHALWQRRFHSDPAAVGRTLTVDGIARTVVGVVPPALGEIVAADLWLPTAIDPNNPERQNHNYGVVARLKPGVTVAQARAEMAVIAARLERLPGHQHRLGHHAVSHGGDVRRPHPPGAADPAGRRRPAAADCLRQPRQPAAGARRHARKRDRHSRRAGRRPPPHHPPIAHRKPGAGAGRRRAGTGAGGLGRAPAAQRGSRHVPHAATHAAWTCPCWLSPSASRF